MYTFYLFMDRLSTGAPAKAGVPVHGGKRQRAHTDRSHRAAKTFAQVFRKVWVGRQDQTPGLDTQVRRLG